MIEALSPSTAGTDMARLSFLHAHALNLGRNDLMRLGVGNGLAIRGVANQLRKNLLR